MGYLFTSESVSEGHPDKVADQISDALVDAFLAYDENSKTACETLVTTGQVVLAGEVKSSIYVDVQEVARQVIKKIGYTKSEYRFDGDSCGVFSSIHEQSEDINRGVDGAAKIDPMNQGAGDQGMMFGYACKDTDNYMPLPLELSHRLLRKLADIRREGKVMTYLRPDSKSQVTIEYNDKGKPERIHTIVVSTQHDEFIPAGKGLSQEQADAEMLSVIRKDIQQYLLPAVFNADPGLKALLDDKLILHVNPTGKFVIGGPHGDSGLTGRKIIVDTYGGKGAHGGGAFSGKDPSKVDRSAAYAARHIAKNLVAAGVADEILIQVSYAIGVAHPVNIFVDTYGKSRVKISDGEIAEKVVQLFDMRPKAIEQRLKLRKPIYSETASYGHFGREPQKLVKHFSSRYEGDKKIEVVSRWTGIPVYKMMQSERMKLLRLEEELHRRVIGQDEAINAVADAIRRSRAGLQDPKRPIGSFIFLGSTGVGKTELAKALAEYLFNDENTMIRIDMSEYQEKFSVTRLIGSPPGYVGYDQGGQLTEAVRHKPYSVVLFDEIEKAHPDVFNILLQVLDDGHLTDNKGRKVNFKNTIVIMTSNLGSELIRERMDQMNVSNRDQLMEQTREEVFELLKRTLRPEFLNRVDEIIMFKSLTRSEIKEIVRLQLEQLKSNLAERGLRMRYTDKLLDHLAKEAYHPQFGARPVKRLIQRELLNSLSKALLSGSIQEDSLVEIDESGGEILFRSIINPESQGSYSA
jgi:S-adenosylmethionine synthetase